MKYYTVFIIALFIIFTQGCDSLDAADAKKDRQSNNLQTKIDTNETRNSGAGISLEEKFTPPNFMIRDFSVTPKKKTLDLEIIYLINDQLYATLEQNVNYYFQVALPGKIQRFTGADKTQIVQGQKVEKNRLDYSVKVKVKLKKPVETQQMEEIREDREGYQLYILDQEKDPIHFFDDIELFSTMGPLKSKHEVIKSK